ncbi:MAG: FtsX-like permease family protein, partial [Rikenellaceae bacterium]|nr:FtsX-like permease family protein [Rikenellaceae bacterium]
IIFISATVIIITMITNALMLCARTQSKIVGTRRSMSSAIRFAPSAMLIILLERTRMIGLLKAMGMRNGAIQRVFLYRSLYIVARGALWGNIVGLVICALQRWGHIVKLDPSGYMLSEVPISVEVWWWLALNVGTVAVIVLLMVIPTMIISFIKPETTIRYQ